MHRTSIALIVAIISAAAFLAPASADQAVNSKRGSLAQGQIIALLKGERVAQIWNQCTEDSHCGVGHHCCFYSSGNRCRASNVRC
jgi:hypothetical protein